MALVILSLEKEAFSSPELRQVKFAFDERSQTGSLAAPAPTESLKGSLV